MKRWMWIGLGVLFLPGFVAAGIGGITAIVDPESAARWEAEREAEKAANRRAYDIAEAERAAKGSWSYFSDENSATATLQSEDTVRMPGNVLGSYVNLTVSSTGGAWFRVTNGGGVSCPFDDVRVSIDNGPQRSFSCTKSEYDREVVYLDGNSDLASALMGSKTLKLDFGTVSERKVVVLNTTNLRPIAEWPELA